MRSRNCKQICTRGGQLFRWHLKFLVKLRVKVTEAFHETMRINSKIFNAKFWRLLRSFYYFLFQFKTVFSKLLTENHSLSSASSHGKFSSTIMRTWTCPKYVIIDESDSSCSNTRDSWKYPQLSPINSAINYNRLNGALKIANNQTDKETEIKLFARESFVRLLVYFFPRNSAISLNLML